MNQYIGDKNCAHNAHSPHLRCAINPFGPCEGCPDFRKASVGDRISRRLQIVRSCDRKRILQIGLEISLGLAGAIVVGVPTGRFGWTGVGGDIRARDSSYSLGDRYCSGTGQLFCGA